MAKYTKYRAKRDKAPQVGQVTTDSRVANLNDLQEELDEEPGLEAKQLDSVKRSGKKSMKAKKLRRKSED